MQTPINALIRPGHADRIVAGHPWIFGSSILRLTREAEDGDIVQVKDHRKRFLGMGFYNSRSKIQIRMIAWERTTIDQNFFERRIREAVKFREKFFPNASSFRVINAESDFLSGMIVDKYGDHLVVQISSLALELRKSEILASLASSFPDCSISENQDLAFRKFEGIEPSPPSSTAETENTQVDINMNDLRFRINLSDGHKTGAYLDQQTNYQAVARLIGQLGSPRVLDCFTYRGGFALHAAKAGAKYVLGLDQSSDAIDAANEHARLNDLDDKCRFETANVFDWLKSRTSNNNPDRIQESFDAVILDPPSFTRSRSNLANAARGYKEIHLRALKLLNPGGVLATFSCSHHISREIFMDIILESAHDAKRRLRLLESYDQSLDHPIIPAIPETEYLKGFSFEAL
jgi:23S rRNA (cytosine1962-C5)-methyltransferase